MAQSNITTEQVREAIEQFAAMAVAASVSPQTVANILEMLRNLNDQEKEEITAVAEDFIQRIASIGITGKRTQSEDKEIRFETDFGVLIGKIDESGADFKYLKKDGKNVATEDQIPTVPTVPTLDTSIGKNPSNSHTPSTKAVKDYVDGAVASVEVDLPISEESTHSEDEEMSFTDDAGSQAYVKVGSYGMKSKAYLDLQGNSVIPAKDTTIGESPSNTHVPTTQAVKDYVDGNTMSDLPIHKKVETDTSGEKIIVKLEDGTTVLTIDKDGINAVDIKRNGQPLISESEDGIKFNDSAANSGSVEVYDDFGRNMIDLSMQGLNCIVPIKYEDVDILDIMPKCVSSAHFSTNSIEKCAKNKQYIVYGGDEPIYFNQGVIGKKEVNIVKFAIISDLHINECPSDLRSSYQAASSYWWKSSSSSYDYTTIINALSHIDEQGCDFVLGLGDIVDYGYGGVITETQINKFYQIIQSTLHKTIFITQKGNHDHRVEQWTSNGVLNFGNLNLIFLDADYVSVSVGGQPGGTGVISDASLTWLDTVLTSNADKVNVLCMHYCLGKNARQEDDPCVPTLHNICWWTRNEFTSNNVTYDGNRDRLIDILESHNVTLMLNGHEHDNDWHRYTVEEYTSLTDVNCGTATGTYAICTFNRSMGTFAFEVFDLANNSLFTFNL